ncbi:MAG: hypothetical protein ACI9OH_001531 [Oleispira sp.]|jgi:hypothetical protein
MRLKTMMFSIAVFCTASEVSLANLPEFKTALPMQTYDVGESMSDTNIIIMNHNKAKQVLLVRLDNDNNPTGFSIADMSKNISAGEAMSHLNGNYLTGVNAGFLENYPDAPNNLAQYTDLGFDSSSDGEDFNIVAKRLISEATGYLYSQNLMIPWQNGFSGYQLSDGYVTVDDIDGNNINGYYRCKIEGWAENESVTEHCEAIVGFDFDKFNLAGSAFMGRTASDKAFSFAHGFLGNLDTGTYSEANNSLFYYGESAVEISMKDFNGSDMRYIKVHSDDSLTRVAQEGFFVPTPAIGTIDSIGIISDGDYIYFSDSGELESAKECRLEYSSFDFTENSEDSSFEAMLNELITTGAEYRVVLGNYPNLPEDIAAANIILGDIFVITATTTNVEFKQAMDDGFLTDHYVGWLESYHTSLEQNAIKYPGEYFHCLDQPIPADPFLMVSMFGSLAFVGDYLYGSKGNPADVSALTTYVYDLEGNYQYLSGELASFLTKGIPEEKKSIIRNEIIAENSGFSEYPDLSEAAKEILLKAGSPDGMEAQMTVMYADAMQSMILAKLGYLEFGAFASVAADHSSVLMGEALSSGPRKGIGGFTGRANKKSYLLIFESMNTETVSVKVSPTALTVDPYATPNVQISVDVSGHDIYGLDVSCNLSSSSLSITQANYGDLFGSQNTMILPLIYSASAITATETLVAPELAFTGAGSFALVDVIAEFTTEDVQVICAAEVSDENGQLLQVTLTPATIRIDDGVHGGLGSVSGVIELPGITDLSGVEVVLTIDGRQVTVITDETGHFEFDGLRDGEFTISLASENYVQSCQAANIAEGIAVDLGSIELLAGDINADGNIDIADFTFMAARYRSNQGDADYDAKADLNKDDTINIQDLAILGSHFGSTQCNL